MIGLDSAREGERVWLDYEGPSVVASIEFDLRAIREGVAGVSYSMREWLDEYEREAYPLRPHEGPPLAEIKAPEWKYGPRVPWDSPKATPIEDLRHFLSHGTFVDRYAVSDTSPPDPAPEDPDEPPTEKKLHGSAAMCPIHGDTRGGLCRKCAR